MNDLFETNDLFEIIELKPGWFIRKPRWMSDFEFSRTRFGPLAIPLIIAGTGLAAAGQIQQGRVAAAEGESAQNIANYNAAVMEQQAKAKIFKGRFEQVKQVKRGEEIKSSARVGKPLSLLSEAELAAKLELEMLLIGYESEISAQRAESQATLDRLQGKLYKQRGKNLQTASYFKAGSSLLTGFG